MEIVKNIICVIKKYSAENILKHLNLLPIPQTYISKSNIFLKFFVFLFCFLSEKYFFSFSLGIEKHRLEF